MSKSTLLCLFSLISYSSYCQGKYEVGIETALLRDKNSISDNNKNLTLIPSYGGSAGIHFRINKDNNVFYEFSALVKENIAGIVLKQQAESSLEHLGISLLFPMQVGYRLQFINWLALVPSFGIAPAFKVSKSFILNGGFSNGEVEWHYRARDRKGKFYGLFLGSLGIEHQSLRIPFLKVFFTINEYYQWLQTITVLDIDYKINNGPLLNGVFENKGRFVAYHLGINLLLEKN